MKKLVMSTVLMFIVVVGYAKEVSILDVDYITSWKLLGMSTWGSDEYTNGDMRIAAVIEADQITLVGIDDIPQKIKEVTTAIDEEGLKVTTIKMEGNKFYYTIKRISSNSIMFKLIFVKSGNERLRYILGNEEQ